MLDEDEALASDRAGTYCTGCAGDLAVLRAQRPAPLLSVVVPCFNEAAALPTVIPDLLAALDRRIKTYEVILVDNGSMDETTAVLAHMRPTVLLDQRVHYLLLPKNLGYGGGILHGLTIARGQYVGYTCGDGQVSGDDLVTISLRAIHGGAKVVKARRRTRPDGPFRRVQTRVYNFLMRRWFGVWMKDINAMPKVWKRGLLHPTATDWFIDAELMMQAAQKQLHVAEVPIDYRARIGGRSHVRWWTSLEFLWHLARLLVRRRPPEGAR
jgi:dolichol-phosphate mannosyltransferase